MGEFFISHSGKDRNYGEVQARQQAYQDSVEDKLKSIDQEIIRNPLNNALYCKRAEILFEIHDQHPEVHPEIVRDCLYAAFLNPDNMDAYYILLQTAAKHKEYYGTESLTKILCEHYPEDAELFGCRGYLYSRTKKSAEKGMQR